MSVMSFIVGFLLGWFLAPGLWDISKNLWEELKNWWWYRK
jgi:hypothetical protein